ncbi:MAG: hypothetical protein ABJZ55_02390 [Fuerstiella sp.]
MASNSQQSTTAKRLVIFGAVALLLMFWTCFKIAGVLTGNAAWGPKIGGHLPDGTEVYFQSRPVAFETDDRLTVVAPNSTPKHYWVDRVHGGFEHVVLKCGNTGNQLWVESDGKVGASIDLETKDFRAEADKQHKWAKHGTGKTLDSGNTTSIITLLRPW